MSRFGITLYLHYIPLLQVSILHVSGDWSGEFSSCELDARARTLSHRHTQTFVDFFYLSQMITTVVVLYAAKMTKTIKFQDFDRTVLLKVSVSH